MPTPAFSCANLTVGQLNSLVKKMGGEAAVLDYLRGSTLPEPKLRDYRPFEVPSYAEITDAEGFRTRIRNEGMIITDSADQLLGTPLFHEAASRWSRYQGCMAAVSAEDLGLSDQPEEFDSESLYSILVTGRRLGLKPCTPVMGPQARLCLTKQLEDFCFIVIMDPIGDKDGKPQMFFLTKKHNKLILDTYEVEQGVAGWATGTHFLFQGSNKSN